MSAEPATPEERPHLNRPGPAPVISLNTRRHRSGGGQPTTRGQRRVMDHTPSAGHTSQPDDDHTSLHRFADSIETSFLEIQQSLTDPRTAAAYLKTLDVWETALKGSHAQGIIDARQLRDLTEVLHGMRRAPRLI